MTTSEYRLLYVFFCFFALQSAKTCQDVPLQTSLVLSYVSAHALLLTGSQVHGQTNVTASMQARIKGCNHMPTTPGYLGPLGPCLCSQALFTSCRLRLVISSLDTSSPRHWDPGARRPQHAPAALQRRAEETVNLCSMHDGERWIDPLLVP